MIYYLYNNETGEITDNKKEAMEWVRSGIRVDVMVYDALGELSAIGRWVP